MGLPTLFEVLFQGSSPRILSQVHNKQVTFLILQGTKSSHFSKVSQCFHFPNPTSASNFTNYHQGFQNRPTSSLTLVTDQSFTNLRSIPMLQETYTFLLQYCWFPQGVKHQRPVFISQRSERAKLHRVRQSSFSEVTSNSPSSL